MTRAAQETDRQAARLWPLQKLVALQRVETATLVAVQHCTRLHLETLALLIVY